MSTTITGVKNSIKHGSVKDNHYEDDRIEFGTSTHNPDMVMLRAFESEEYAHINLSIKSAKELGNALLSLAEAMENQ